MLYVGKAKSLRPRVRQYFQAGRSDNRLGIDPLVDARRADRDDRHRHRGRGAPPRAEPRQAPPAAVQRPAARRQVVPLHRGHARGRVPARDVHARAPPPRRPLLRALREREEGARDARRAQPRLPLPALRGAAARAAAAASRASTSTSSAASRPASAASRKEDYREVIDGVDRVPLGQRPADPRRARARRCARPRPRSASRTRRATATGCTRSSGSPSARRSSAPRSARST